MLRFIVVICCCMKLCCAFLAKTTETFKFADLQYLEAKLQVDCKRLLVDAATGSSLFHLTTYNEDNLPSSLQRCEWIGHIVASANNAQDFINVIRQQQQYWDLWTLEYVRMNSENHGPHISTYTSRTLLNCVAQAISSPPALDPADATKRLMVVDIVSTLFLVQIIHHKQEKQTNIHRLWSSRPFAYSSATHPILAEMVIDILDFLVKQHSHPKTTIRLLDPTCGSGTFLAYGFHRGMMVVGRDIHAACVDGTQRNMQHMFGENNNNQWTVEQQDAASEEKTDHVFDCIVANLPWGQNSISYRDENNRIVEQIQKSCHTTFVAFITKEKDIQSKMVHLGFEILGDACIPQRNFVVPNEKSKKRSNSCVVTIAKYVS